MKVPEQYRVTTGLMASNVTYGCNGVFQIPHNRITGYFFMCIASDGSGWQHVSVSIKFLKGKTLWRETGRCPTWEEMCYIKSLFWDDTEVVIQYHPAKSDYVNCHPFCLHLWKPDNISLPVPDPLMVGPK